MGRASRTGAFDEGSNYVATKRGPRTTDGVHLDDLHHQVLCWARSCDAIPYWFDRKGRDFFRSVAWQGIEKRLTSKDILNALESWRAEVLNAETYFDPLTVPEAQKLARQTVCRWAAQRQWDERMDRAEERFAVYRICEMRRNGWIVPRIPDGHCAAWLRQHQIDRATAA